ncbi:MAG: DNA polymerase III subunit beta [Limisphaerales bacterium]
MKLSIAKDAMLVGLQAVQNVVGSRSSLPILSNVLLRATGTTLELTATDLDLTITSQVTATVVKPGATTLPVRRLFSICRELTNLELELESDDKHLATLTSGNSYYRINGLPPDEFPAIPQLTEKKDIVLPQERLRSMMKRTAYAMSTDESRYVLNGLFFNLKEHKLTLVATDGRRLALVEEDVDVPPGSEGEFIVPSKTVTELGRLLTGAGEVDLRYTENQAAFRLQCEGQPEVRIVTKLVEGAYPNYRQVIPTDSKERIRVVREELLQALRRAEIMTSEKSNSVKLTFSKNNLAITANTPEVGEARESLAINYKGPDLQIAFNPAYVMDPLRALEVEEVTLDLNDELSPGVLRTEAQFLYVIMPMRVS